MSHALGVGNPALSAIYSYLLCRTLANVSFRYQTSTGILITNPLAHILLIRISTLLSSSLHSAELSMAIFIRQISRVCTWYSHSLIPKAKACISECSSLASVLMNTKSHVALTVRFPRVMLCLANSFNISILTLYVYMFPRYHHISAQVFQAQSLNALQNSMYHQTQRGDSTRLDPCSQSAYVVNRTPKTKYRNSLWLDAFVPKCFSRGLTIGHPEIQYISMIVPTPKSHDDLLRRRCTDLSISLRAHINLS